MTALTRRFTDMVEMLVVQALEAGYTATEINDALRVAALRNRIRLFSPRRKKYGARNQKSA